MFVIPYYETSQNACSEYIGDNFYGQGYQRRAFLYSISNNANSILSLCNAKAFAEAP